jgi:putative flippase GtrA
MSYLTKKRDIVFSLICGELSAWFLIFVIKNPYIEEFKSLAALENLIWALPIIFPLGFLFGILIGKVISRLIRVIFQIVKFLEVGVLNTLIDIGILNLLVWLTGVTSGFGLAPLNTVSFLTAATNSYFWNKFWTFKKGKEKRRGEFLQFLIISAIGWGINTGIVVLGTTYLAPIANLSAGAWVNIMKLTATFVSMTWNFIGYKFIVFKK